MAVTVGDFMEAAKDKAKLEVVIGQRGLTRLIHEPAIHRPGLTLAGFYRHFAFRRIQVMGMAESEYLSNMDGRQRRQRLRQLFRRHIPCLVITRGRKVWPEILNLAREFNVVVLRTPMITGAFINTATVVMENLMAPRVTLQGTMVDIMGIGVLIEGKPGIGKSEAALALVVRGHSLVSDDVTVFRRSDDRTIIGASSPITRYHIEIRGLGFIHVPSLFGVASVRDEKALDLILTLKKFEELGEGGGRDLTPLTQKVLGVSITRLIVPVAAGRELANVIEVAALNEKLKRLGHDAAKELDQKLISVMTKGATHREL